MVIGNSNLFEVGSQIFSEKIGDANVFECKCTSLSLSFLLSLRFCLGVIPSNVVVGKGCAIGPAVTLKQSTDTITLEDGQRQTDRAVMQKVTRSVGVALHGAQADRVRVENAVENHLSMLSKHLEVLSKTLPTFHRLANAPVAASSPAKT